MQPSPAPTTWKLLRTLAVCAALVAGAAGCSSAQGSANAGQARPTGPAAETSSSTPPAPSPSPTPTPTPSPSKPEPVRTSARPAAPTVRTSAPAKPQDQGNGTVRGRSELVDALNVKRRAMGLKPVAYNANLSAEAESCSRKSLNAGTLTHCGYEVLAMGGANMTVDQLITMWFNSPPHKAALTHSTSTIAGGAIVSNGKNLVAAIRIDY